MVCTSFCTVTGCNMRIPKGFIQRTGLQQFCLCPCCLDMAIVYNNNLVGIHDSESRWAMTINVLPCTSCATLS